ncbi:MAG: APC family permease, partial [Cellulosilyticaceae bacterium]
MSRRVDDGKMGVGDTISMAMGFAVGSGVITMTGVAIGITGRSVIFSYLLTAGMFLLAVIPTLIMGVIYPTRSASYVYSKELIHPKMGGFYMYIYFMGRLTIAIFGISIAQYLATLLPGINESIAAVVILTFFYLI